jgi:hypothetical protein
MNLHSELWMPSVAADLAMPCNRNGVAVQFKTLSPILNLAWRRKGTRRLIYKPRL